MHEATGGCHCKNLTYNIETTKNINTHKPRACDCDFCSKHSASYISDPKGTFEIIVSDENNLERYKVGSGVADFLVCKACGVFVGVCYEDQGCIYGSINSKTIDGEVSFGNEVVISPKQLSDLEKTTRWKDIWFANVKISI